MTPASEPVRCAHGKRLYPTGGQWFHVPVSIYSPAIPCEPVIPPTPEEVRLIDLEHREEYGEGGGGQGMSKGNPERDELPAAVKIAFPNGSEIFMLPAARLETILRDKNVELARLKEELAKKDTEIASLREERDRYRTTLRLIADPGVDLDVETEARRALKLEEVRK